MKTYTLKDFQRDFPDEEASVVSLDTVGRMIAKTG
jgi:hypothetical protein